MSPEVAVNVRATGLRLTGVQRYVHEMVRHLEPRVRHVAPKRALQGPRGHLWEQSVLPLRTGRDLLWSPANTGPAALRRQVVTIHDASPLDHPEWFSPPFAAWYRFLLPRLMQVARQVITGSEFSRERLIDHGAPSEKVTAIPLAADSRFGLSSATRLEEVSNHYRLPRHYVLVLGSLEPRKNLRRTFAAWERVAAHAAGVELVVAGGSDAIYRDVAIDRLPPRTRILGYVDDRDLPTLYAGARALLYPSLYEGFGLPPLEAMASGTPVVTSNRSSLPEVVGDAAITVNPSDVEAIAEGLRELLEDGDVAGRCRSLGRAQAKSFTWNRTAELTWRVLSRAADA